MIHFKFCESRSRTSKTYDLRSCYMFPRFEEKDEAQRPQQDFVCRALVLRFASLLLSFVTSFFRTLRRLGYQFGTTMESKLQFSFRVYRYLRNFKRGKTRKKPSRSFALTDTSESIKPQNIM